MSLSKRNIANLLAGIFLFPVLFQPWHILHHHRDQMTGHLCAGEDCQLEASGQVETSILKHARKHCYVCDFEFSVNKLPDEAVLLASCHIYQELKFGLLNPCCETSLLLQSSPRAPPVS